MKKLISVITAAAVMISTLLLFGVSSSAATLKKVREYKAGDSFTVTLKANKENNYQSSTWDRAYYARFTPEADGDYEFQTSSLDFYAEAGYRALITDSNDNVISYAYALGEDSFSIDIAGHLKGGETYYYLVKYENDCCKRTVKLNVKLKKHKHKLIRTDRQSPDAEHMLDATDENGNPITMCKIQGCYDSGVEVYNNIFTIEPSRKAYTYDGTAKKPKIIFRDMRGKRFTPDFSYKKKYEKNTNVGFALIKVKANGVWRNIRFKIVPASTKINGLISRKSGFTVKWKKQAVQTTGYQICYATNKAFKNRKVITVKSNKTLSHTVKKLKSGKTYYVRVRTIKMNKAHTLRSRWSEPKKIKTK